MRNFHDIRWRDAISQPTRMAFVALYGFESFTRASLVTVIPLAAYEQLGDAQLVSALFFGAAIVGLLSSFLVPWLVQTITRRGVVTMGCIIGVGAMAGFITQTAAGLAAGMCLSLFAGACLEIGTSTYLLDTLPRREMGRFEPLRNMFLGVTWTIGPFTGIWLRTEIGATAPFYLTAALFLSFLAYFWILRLTDAPALATARPKRANPFLFIRRFMSQPRLRLAWILAAGRAGWWGMFFIYMPIYIVDAGYGEQTAGLVGSTGTLFTMLSAIAYRWVGHLGARRLLIAGYGLTGLGTILIAVFADFPTAAVAACVVASFFAMPIDAVGNSHFLRAVHPYERAEMTTVFATYRYTAQLSFPGAFSLVLGVFQLPAVFVTAGIGMLGLAGLASYIPKSMR
ncbi:MAG: MFS transporter [Rhodospirillales bacterium]